MRDTDTGCAAVSSVARTPGPVSPPGPEGSLFAWGGGLVCQAGLLPGFAPSTLEAVSDLFSGECERIFSACDLGDKAINAGYAGSTHFLCYLQAEHRDGVLESRELASDAWRLPFCKQPRLLATRRKEDQPNRRSEVSPPAGRRAVQLPNCVFRIDAASLSSLKPSCRKFQNVHPRRESLLACTGEVASGYTAVEELSSKP